MWAADLVSARVGTISQAAHRDNGAVRRRQRSRRDRPPPRRRHVETSRRVAVPVVNRPGGGGAVAFTHVYAAEARRLFARLHHEHHLHQLLLGHHSVRLHGVRAGRARDHRDAGAGRACRRTLEDGQGDDRGGQAEPGQVPHRQLRHRHAHAPVGVGAVPGRRCPGHRRAVRRRPGDGQSPGQAGSRASCSCRRP